MAKVKKEVEELEVPVEVNEVVDAIKTEGTIITDEVVNVEPEVEVPVAKVIDKCKCDGLPIIVKNRRGSIKVCTKCNKPK